MRRIPGRCTCRIPSCGWKRRWWREVRSPPAEGTKDKEPEGGPRLFFPQGAPPCPQAQGDDLLVPGLGGIVVGAPAERFREVLLGDEGVGEIVRVLVSLPVAQILHQAGGGVAQGRRHRMASPPLRLP